MRKWIGFAALIAGAIAAVRFVDLVGPEKQPVPAMSRDPFPTNAVIVSGSWDLYPSNEEPARLAQG